MICFKMWFQKRKEQQQRQDTEKKERELFKAICDSLTALEKRMASVEIEIDSFKLRWKKKLIEPEEEKKKDINSDVILAI